MYQFYITVSLIFFSICTFGQNESNDTNSEWLTYSTEQFEIKYPQDWELDSSGKMGTQFILFSPHIQGDLFSENINLITQDVEEQGLTLDDFVQITEEQIANFYNSAEIFESQRQNRGTENEFHKTLFSAKQGTFSLYFQQYYWIVNKQLYVLTLTVDKDQSKKFQPIGNKIMDSFRIKQ